MVDKTNKEKDKSDVQLCWLRCVFSSCPFISSEFYNLIIVHYRPQWWWSPCRMTCCFLQSKAASDRERIDEKFQTKRLQEPPHVSPRYLLDVDSRMQCSFWLWDLRKGAGIVVGKSVGTEHKKIVSQINVSNFYVCFRVS